MVDQDREPQPRHWALLVGINAYPEKSEWQPLDSCVQDVVSLGKCLEAALAGKSSITVLAHGDEAPSDEPSPNLHAYTADVPISSPTHDNILTHLDRITTLARRGDSVYIHFSGHGTARPACEHKHSNTSSGDLAWVVLHEPSHGLRYLHGRVLAKRIRTMVQQGLHVTLALDCCSSGSVLRLDDEDDDARYADWDDSIDEAFPSDEDDDGVHDVVLVEDAYRDGSMTPSWIVNPSGYTVVTACMPHEIAKRTADLLHGRLSYFLLAAFKDPSIGPLANFSDIYSYVRARFRGEYPRQHPMWYGSGSRAFFGEGMAISAAPFLVFKRPSAVPGEKPLIMLDGGRAHGISEGDQFDVYIQGREEKKVDAAVIQIGPLVSVLGLVDPGRLQDIDAPLAARARTWSALKQFPIRLDSALSKTDEWADVLARRPWLSFTGTEPCDFEIRRHTEQNKYSILDAKGQPLQGAESAFVGAGEVVRAAENLAKFMLVKHLHNNDAASTFAGHGQEFSILLCAKDKDGVHKYQPGETVSIRQGQKLQLSMENLSADILYVHALDLGPRWNVCNLLQGDGIPLYPANFERPHFEVGKRLKNNRFTMVVPSDLVERGVRECTDTLKIMVTKYHTSFEPLLLPILGRGGREADEDGLRTGPGGTSIPVKASSEAWTALEFHVRTRCS